MTEDKQLPLPFRGEKMTCLACGDELQSSPNGQSNWTFISIGNVGYYICEKCWNNPSRIDVPAYYDRLRKLLGDSKS